MLCWFRLGVLPGGSTVDESGRREVDRSSVPGMLRLYSRERLVGAQAELSWDASTATEYVDTLFVQCPLTSICRA